MNDTSAHIATLDQADEEILTPTVSDDALEAAAGTERSLSAQCNSLSPGGPLCPAYTMAPGGSPFCG
jgi:hypothetical protein